MSKGITSCELFELVMQRIKQQIESISYSRAMDVFIQSQMDLSYISSVKKICQWFAQEKEFESNVGYTLKKGIYLKGQVGSGKSTVMNVISEISRELKLPTSFRSIDARTIASQYKKKGDEALLKYTENSFCLDTTGRFHKLDISRPATWYLDDFGLELELVNGQYQLPAHYANKSNVMAEIILDRYNFFVRYGMITHISLNVRDGDTIEKMYGIQVRSRMRQMFNTIELTSPDKRV